MFTGISYLRINSFLAFMSLIEPPLNTENILMSFSRSAILIRISILVFGSMMVYLRSSSMFSPTIILHIRRNSYARNLIRLYLSAYNDASQHQGVIMTVETISSQLVIVIYHFPLLCSMSRLAALINLGGTLLTTLYRSKRIL